MDEPRRSGRGARRAGAAAGEQSWGPGRGIVKQFVLQNGDQEQGLVFVGTSEDAAEQADELGSQTRFSLRYTGKPSRVDETVSRPEEPTRGADAVVARSSEGVEGVVAGLRRAA